MHDQRERFAELVAVIRRLRDENGCPWDRKQTPHSLQQYLRAECDELMAAIGNNDPANTCEELGDLLYIVMMYAEIHADRGEFGLAEVIAGIVAKLTRRHPHVFAGKSYENEEQLARQWQEIKEMEKKKNII